MIAQGMRQRLALLIAPPHCLPCLQAIHSLHDAGGGEEEEEEWDDSGDWRAVPAGHALRVVCNLFNLLLLRLPDLVHDRIRVLNTLAFAPGFVIHLWDRVRGMEGVLRSAFHLMDDVTAGPAAPLGSRAPQPLSRSHSTGGRTSRSQQAVACLRLFADTYSHLLHTMDDSEFFGGFHAPHLEADSGIIPVPCDGALPRDELLAMITLVRDLAVSLFLNREVVMDMGDMDTRALRASLVALLNHLHSRYVRHPFCAVEHWLSHPVNILAKCRGLNRLTAVELKEGFRDGSAADAGRAVGRAVEVQGLIQVRRGGGS